MTQIKVFSEKNDPEGVSEMANEWLSCIATERKYTIISVIPSQSVIPASALGDENGNIVVFTITIVYEEKSAW